MNKTAPVAPGRVAASAPRGARVTQSRAERQGGRGLGERRYRGRLGLQAGKKSCDLPGPEFPTQKTGRCWCLIHRLVRMDDHGGL